MYFVRRPSPLVFTWCSPFVADLLYLPPVEASAVTNVEATSGAGWDLNGCGGGGCDPRLTRVRRARRIPPRPSKIITGYWWIDTTENKALFSLLVRTRGRLFLPLFSVSHSHPPADAITLEGSAEQLYRYDQVPT